MLASLGSMAGCELRIWRFGRGRLRPVVACEQVEAPALRADREGNVVVEQDFRWVAPVPDTDGYWFEIVDARGTPEEAAATLAPLLTKLLSAERETLDLAKELASRFEEIDLLYTISHVLGRTIRLETAAEIILREVSTVVGARRASLLVVDDEGKMLVPVAGMGRDISRLGRVPVDHPTSIAAKVFREGTAVAHDPRVARSKLLATESGVHYLGAAFLSVPILYPSEHGNPRPVGVINLTNRIGTDVFSDGELKLVAAVAGQIGAAIENARLIERVMTQERMAHEIELAHDLQLKLLPSPTVLGDDVDLAARCIPAASVGGDFYHFVRLSGRRVGVMLGDVSSHGFAAALIMALVLSAAGIHAGEAESAEETVRRILDSVKDELAETEMHLSLFFAVLDLERNTMQYANAGHPHAFRVSPDGTWQRLGATSPPLGLSDDLPVHSAKAPWASRGDRLILFSDGVSDAMNAEGERFGEERVLELVAAHAESASQLVLDRVLEALGTYDAAPHDDRTLLVLRS